MLSSVNISVPASQPLVISNKQVASITISDIFDDGDNRKASILQAIFLQKIDELQVLLKESKESYFYREIFYLTFKELELKKIPITFLSLAAIRGPISIISVVMDQTENDNADISFLHLSKLKFIPLEHQNYILFRLFSRLVYTEETSRLFGCFYVNLCQLPNIQSPLKLIGELFISSKNSYSNEVAPFLKHIRPLSSIVVDYLFECADVEEFILETLSEPAAFDKLYDQRLYIDEKKLDKLEVSLKEIEKRCLSKKKQAVDELRKLETEIDKLRLENNVDWKKKALLFLEIYNAHVNWNSEVRAFYNQAAFFQECNLHSL